MNLRHSLILSAVALSTLVLMSNSNGVAHQQNKDRTGAPGSQNTCQQCHGGGSFEPTMQVFLVAEGDIALEGQYLPGATHTLVVSLNSTGSPQGFGVHGTVVFPDGENAGTLVDQDPNDCIWLDEVNGRHIFEQNDLCSSGFFEVEWTAPASGSGDVEVYVASIAANGNGTSTGDVFVGGQFTFTESVVGIGEQTVESGLRVWSEDEGTLQFECATGGQALVLSPDGRILWEGRVESGRTPVVIGHSGLTVVRLVDDAGAVGTRKLWMR